MQRTEFDTLIVCDNFLDNDLLEQLTELVTGAETIAKCSGGQVVKSSKDLSLIHI